MASPVAGGHRKREHPSCAPPRAGFMPASSRQPGTRSIGRCVGTRACRSSRCRHKRRVFCRPLLVANRTSYITPPSCICKPALPAGRLSHPLSRAAKSPKLTGLRACLFPWWKRTEANDSSPKECYVLRTICAAKLMIGSGSCKQNLKINIFIPIPRENSPDFYVIKHIFENFLSKIWREFSF